jgi:thiamine biosynthesis lipoprotein
MKTISFLLVVATFLTSCSQGPEVLHFSGNTMGTTYNIKYLASTETSIDLLKPLVDQRLIELNNQMSTYIPSSDLSKFNKSSSLEWQSSPSELLFVVNHALNVGQLSNGAFDPTIGPLVNLWGFGPTGKRKVPSENDIKEALKNVGLDKITLDLSTSKWKKNTMGVYVDLSALAKGYGVDKIAALLEEKGVLNYMVEIGGEVKTLGSKNSKPWAIAIESPNLENKEKSYQRVLKLSSKAMATSGNYRNFFKEGSRHYSHTIDFKTGRPVSHTLASVSVIDDSSCMNADAWATALMSMGFEKGLEIAEKLKISAYFIYKLDSEADFSVKETTEFKKQFK